MEIARVEENKNNIVKKHQDLVRNARYRLSELGIKVLSVLISMVKTSDKEFHQYAIPIKDFQELVDSDSKNTYKYAHRLISELMSHPIKIGDEQFNWVSYGKHHKGDGVIVFEIHRLLKPYLLELQKNFLQYEIANILTLRSGYVIRLYELCKDYYAEEVRYKPKQKSVQFELKIDRMREMFEIPPSYQYKDIRVNVIDKAVKQFKEKTDIQISYTEQKIGRKVDRIIISVRSNDQGSGSYMSSRVKFIEYVRKMYRPDGWEGVFPPIVKAKNGTLKIDNDGRLYVVDPNALPGTNEIDHKQADKLWSWLYDGVKSGEFELIPPPAAAS